MDAMELALAFIERCQQGAPLQELSATFRRILEQLGFRYFACCSHVDPLWPPRWSVMILHYPTEWVRYFSDQQLYHVDPVYRHADRALRPFSWDAASFLAGLNPSQRGIMAEARSFGLEHGYTIPIHLPGMPGRVQASCSVVPAGPSVERRNYLIVDIMANYMFAAAREDALQRHPRFSRARLSERERQCLALAASGMTDAGIARQLNLAPSTVHNHIANIAERLGATKRIQAAMFALEAGELSMGDILRSEISAVPRRPVKRAPRVPTAGIPATDTSTTSASTPEVPSPGVEDPPAREQAAEK